MNWFVMVFQAVVYASALLVLRHSLPQLGKTGFSVSTVLLVSLGAALTVASFALWLYILKENSLSVAYPISVGLSLIMTSVGAWWLLSERIAIFQVVGMFVLMVGIVLVSWEYKGP